MDRRASRGGSATGPGGTVSIRDLGVGRGFRTDVSSDSGTLNGAVGWLDDPSKPVARVHVFECNKIRRCLQLRVHFARRGYSEGGSKFTKLGSQEHRQRVIGWSTSSLVWD